MSTFQRSKWHARELQQSHAARIETGLEWLLEHYKPDGIQSIALPALGCGLGGLDWKEMGPLMCKYLPRMDVRAVIYLPQEQPIAPEFVSRDFLLG